MTPPPGAYKNLESRFARLGAVEDALGILDWDSLTMMPAGAAEGRAAQIATLRVIAHELLTDPRIPDLLAAAESEPGLTDGLRANLREMRRAVVHASAVPAELVEVSSRAVSACEMTWRIARPANDFAALLPSLTEVLALQREIGAAKAAVLGVSPYEALLNSYEPGVRTAELDLLFDELAVFLPEFLPRVLERQEQLPAPLPLSGHYSIVAQRALGEKLMHAVGFDFNRGRLDVSLHPFCGGASGDVRLTTRYDEFDFSRALMGVLHESGHALYEQGRPMAWAGQPVGAARGMALHESQSLIIEMQAARSRSFLNYLGPLVQEAFGKHDPALKTDNLYRHYTMVKPDFIRVDADEVTYPAHVILRYRLEKAMISGDLALIDLPGAWAEGMRGLLGIVPPDDRQGCLQDIHWPSGGWGYFPTYTLGAAIAAQLFDASRRAVPDLCVGLAQGDFTPLVTWLRSNVHVYASLFSTKELLIRATGRPLDPAVYRRHLEKRYLEGEE
ncbi:MAG: carboxypeptidase M32 [Rhodospirillaceae bacterium]